MVVEVLGSRVIGPFFGVSLFVWTALITVTLVALAAGYAAGGALADRRADPLDLPRIVLAAGIAVALVPELRVPVIRACLPLGLRGGSLAASAILFGPALFLLGCVSPLVVKGAAVRLDSVGRTVGLLYAISTLGSFAGTLATGFFLIGTFAVDDIFRMTGGLLATVAALQFLRNRKRLALAATCVAIAIAAVPRHDPPPAGRLADGTDVRIVARRDTFYGQIKVVDYRHGSTHLRDLVIDGLVQGGIDVADGRSVYEYAQLIAALPHAMQPDGRRALVVGLGAGAAPMWLERAGVTADVVEIDPAVAAFAASHFGVKLRGRIHIADARTFLADATARYDYILMDAFNGDSNPSHLLTREALRLVHGSLRPSGVAAFNFHGSIGADRAMTDAFARTLLDVFPSVTMLPVFAAERGETWGNIVFVAALTAPSPAALAQAGNHPAHPLAEPGIRAALARARPAAPPPGTQPLTDAYNPVDIRDVGLKERVRMSVLRDTAPSILLH
jgi:spermidine synthase